MSDDQQYPYGRYDQYGRPQEMDGPPGVPGRHSQEPGEAPQDPEYGEGWGEPQGQRAPRHAQGGAVPQTWDDARAAAQPHVPPAQHLNGDPLGELHDPGMTQTWEGQTWDTQYQPHVLWQPEQQQPGHRPEQQPAHQPEQQAHPQAAVPYPAQRQYPPQAAADTAYLPPQGGHPLPPEAPFGAPAPLMPEQAAARYAQDGVQVQAAAPAQALIPDAQAQAGFGADTSTYSPPTTLGNARITDAQRARAEGRSPIIAPGMQPAALTAVLGLLMAVGAAVGPYALLVPLVLLQAVTAAGWFRLNGMWPARQGIALAFAGGLVADVALLAAGKEHAPAAIIGTLGVWILLTLVLQLRSHAGADERLQGLMATIASAALAILTTGHLAAVPDAVVVGTLAVAAATVARALPLPAVASVVVALLAASGAGVVGGGLTDLGGKGALLGLAAGVCALIGLRAASYDYPSRFVHMTAGVALPLTAAAPAVYLLGRALT